MIRLRKLFTLFIASLSLVQPAFLVQQGAFAADPNEEIPMDDLSDDDAENEVTEEPVPSPQAKVVPHQKKLKVLLPKDVVAGTRALDRGEIMTEEVGFSKYLRNGAQLAVDPD